MNPAIETPPQAAPQPTVPKRKVLRKRTLIILLAGAAVLLPILIYCRPRASRIEPECADPADSVTCALEMSRTEWTSRCQDLRLLWKNFLLGDYS